jgi:beta-glucosidase
VSAASYEAVVSPGSVAAVFGSFPIDFAGPSSFSLQFEGRWPAPVFFRSAAQANIQIPWELSGQSQTTLTATVDGQASAPQALVLARFAPGVFSTNMQGIGQGAIMDSSFRLVDASNPAMAGRTEVLIFCTGLGSVSNQPSSGTVSAGNPLNPIRPFAVTSTSPMVLIGGLPAQVLASGLAPGLVGVYQLNVVPAGNTPPGDSVAVVISTGGAISNTVTMAVRPADSDQRASLLVAQMTLDEKIQLVHGGPTPRPRGAVGWVPGISRLGIPDLYMVDGSVGVGNNVGQATALPSSIAGTASWDLNLAYKYGSVIGAEMRAYGVNVNLGGNVNLTGREPRDGRTFETKGEDPILAGKINAAHIRATQDRHVIGGIKHFAFNDQETDRRLADVRIDERGARESDLLAFEIGIRDSNVQSVMCAYNLVNGSYSCQNAPLLNEVLKGDWGFKGFVMSDWGATHSTAAAAQSGLDQEMPGSAWFGDNLKLAVQAGQVPLAQLDDMVRRILRAMFEAGIFDFPASITPVDTAAGQAIAQEAEEQGVVLLKNAGALLPLKSADLKSIAVIGSHADIGVLSGGGSARVIPTGGAALTELQGKVIWVPSSPLRAIQAKAPQASVQFNNGTDAAAAAALAAASDLAIVFVSQWATEDWDLASLSFTDVIHSAPIDQNALVAAVAAANPRTIVVLENGGAQLMPWLDQVGAVLEAWYPGQRGGEAIASILFGDVNPSGKLPLTFPARVEDLPHPVIAAAPNSSTIFPVNYSEGLLVGYKWYDANNITPLFPFGFGLSYTTFSFSALRVMDNLKSANPNFQVIFDLTNTGAVAGAEVGQVYLGLPASAGEPPRRLVGWQKVFLEPGERRRVTVQVDENDSAHPLSYWDVESHGWRTAPGDYAVYVGNSSRNLALAGTLRVGP